MTGSLGSPSEPTINALHGFAGFAADAFKSINTSLAAVISGGSITFREHQHERSIRPSKALPISTPINLNHPTA
jgi:hypothetical protein